MLQTVVWLNRVGCFSICGSEIYLHIWTDIYTNCWHELVYNRSCLSFTHLLRISRNWELEVEIMQDNHYMTIDLCDFLLLGWVVLTNQWGQWWQQIFLKASPRLVRYCVTYLALSTQTLANMGITELRIYTKERAALHISHGFCSSESSPSSFKQIYIYTHKTDIYIQKDLGCINSFIYQLCYLTFLVTKASLCLLMVSAAGLKGQSSFCH